MPVGTLAGHYDGITYIDPKVIELQRQCFQPDLTQIGLYNFRQEPGALNFGFKVKRDCIICVVKTKTLIGCAVTNFRAEKHLYIA